MNDTALQKTELNKILAIVSDYAVLDGSKTAVLNTRPSCVLAEVKTRLNATEEAKELLFEKGISKIEYFPPFDDEIERAKKRLKANVNFELTMELLFLTLKEN